MKTERFILSDTLGEQEDKKLHIQNGFVAKLFLSAGILGFLFCFLSDVQGRGILAISSVLSLVVLGILAEWKQDVQILSLIPAAAGIIGIIINPQGAGQGLLFFCNQWISAWNHSFNQVVPQLQVGTVTTMERLQVLIFLNVLSITWVHSMVGKRQLAGISSFVLGAAFVTALFQLNISSLLMGCMFFGWLYFWIAQGASQRRTGRKVVAILPMALLVLALGFLFRGYMGNDYTVSLKDEIITQAESLRYGTDTLPKGDMSMADEMVGDGNNNTLQLSVENAREMYFKGFVGGTFAEGKWERLSSDAYDNEKASMMKWLLDENFQASLQYGAYETYTNQATKDVKETVTIENVGADRRYLYLPYETSRLLKGDGRMYRDYQMMSDGLFGEDNYSFEQYENDIPTESIVQKQVDMSIVGATEYDQEERVYRAFVYDNYLELSEQDSEQLRTIFFADGDWEGQSLYEVTNQIRLVLQEDTTYVDTPSPYGGDVDFITWFLKEQKAGNSAYYATVATLAYREAGIPARYVEGYYLSATDAQLLNDSEQGEAFLTDANAHAWTEVYMDGMGWMPVEVVPGFYYAEYTTQQVLDAPQSSINIVNQTEEERLEGSTFDQLAPEDIEEDIPETVVKKTIYAAGIVLFIVIVLWLFHYVVRIRHWVIRTVYQKKLKVADNNEGSRRRYHHVNAVLKEADLSIREDYPFENIPTILEHFPQMQDFECRRFIELLQKAVFGQETLTDAEYITVRVFDEKITELVYDSLDIRKKYRMKYGKVLL